MSNTIKYTTSKWIKDEFSVIVEDVRHCFFDGASDYNGLTEYLGKYRSGGREKTIFIGHDKAIKIICDSDGTGGHELDIKKFYEDHRNCRQISAEQFFRELRRVVKKLGIDTYESS